MIDFTTTFAQAAVSPEVGALGDILSQGVLGALVIILLYAYWRKDKELKEINAGRLQDSKDVAKDVTTVIQANTTSINLLAAKIETGKQGRTA